MDRFTGVADEALYLSLLTLGELRKAVETLPRGAKRERLRQWVESELPTWFGERLLPVDAAVADPWERLLATTKRTPSASDSLIAAPALRHDLRVVTRNVADFEFPRLEVVNPWKSSR